MSHPVVSPGTAAMTRSVEIAVDLAAGTSMPAFLAIPETGSGPGVLVIPDIDGRSPFSENMARRLAGLGYVAVCPEPFHRMPPLDRPTSDTVLARAAASNELEMLADLRSAIDRLRSLEEVSPGRIAVVGFGMGGTLALQFAATLRDVATVCFYGFPAGSKGPSVAAPAPLTLVDDMSGPLIGFWGEGDTTVGFDTVRRFADALSRRDIVFHSMTYPGVGHGFMAAVEPDDRTRDAARHAWMRMTAFLRRHVAVD